MIGENLLYNIFLCCIIGNNYEIEIHSVKLYHVQTRIIITALLIIQYT